MKALKVILIIIGILIVIILGMYAYYGGFRKIDFKVEKQGRETIVYENVIGDYSQTPKYTDKIYYALLNDEKIETTKGIGIFYDNPQEVDKDKLRSEVGCILDNTDDAILAQLSGKHQIKTLPEADYIVTEFPMKGAMSFMVSVIRVYPALNKYCKEHGYKDSPITEIYDISNKKIVYRKEVIK
ncbi:MAG: GyrI-like domain-containing protein [Bacteroidales bacterium]|jgi:DNA gyrase inhibitor GyrI|nr:GyrI-like domain-containing protein [Bacteroidales bacterium]